jgi:glycosyltransferase involved in cell wall biosynthesis
MKEIVFIHLLNNFSGSPRVLATVICAMSGKYKIDLITSQTDGFLSGIEGIKYINNYYKWTNSKFVTLFLFVISQFVLFFKVLFYKKQNTVFYINTIMPAGAALACKISGKEMIYHIHEDMFQKKSFYPLLKTVYAKCNTKTIFVSKYLQNITATAKKNCVIYNCLDDDFVVQRDLYFASVEKKEKNTILLVSSLRKYKGVDEFVELAKMLSGYQFEMVLSATNDEIKQYFQTKLPENLTIYPLQNNLHPFYQRTRVLLQLSHPDEWIETFGLTILEAIAYGVPAIVPNVGGPIELIEDELNGYTANPLDVEFIKQQIILLMENECVYQKFSGNALQKSQQFDKEKMTTEIEKYILE